MDLWIRSQDGKKLIKVNELKMETVKGGNTFIYSDVTDLGTYKTKERALEVLDEIQNKLRWCLKATNNNTIAGTTVYVYEMPIE